MRAVESKDTCSLRVARRVLAGVGVAVGIVMISVTPAAWAQSDSGTDGDSSVSAGTGADAGTEGGSSTNTSAAADAGARVTEPPGLDDPSLQAPRVTTGIDGNVIDARTHEPIIEAFVSLGEGRRRVRTDLDGNFAIEIAPGEYTIRVFFHLYDAMRIERIVVRRGRVAHLGAIALQPQRGATVLHTQEAPVTARVMTATAAGLVQARRQAATVSDGVSQEDIARLPDNTAGDIIRRVPGVSLVGGQYAVVRGLGGRYVNVLLNGVPLPYTDPDIPAFQLDILPGALLASLNLVKTFTPDMPGDFAGGSLQISSREYPTRLTFTGSVTLGIDSLTGSRGVLRYRGGALDWLGIDDGTRALPSAVPRVRVESGHNGLSQADVAAISRSFPNIWAIGRTTSPPLGGLALTLGNTLRIANRPFGYLFSVTYNAAVRRVVDELRPSRRGAGGVLEPREEIWREYSNTSTLLGVLGSLNYQPAVNHDIGLVTLWTQSSTDLAAVRSGIDETIDADTVRRLQQFVQRTMIFTQLFGDHRELPGHLRIRWQGFFAYGGRNEPDTRGVSYSQVGDRYAINAGGTGVSRLYSSLGQIDGGGSADFALSLGPVTPRIGVFARLIDRSFSLRRFNIEARNLPYDAATSPPEVALAPERYGDQIELVERTFPNDSYRSIQQLVAPFARVDVQIANRVRLIGGARVEIYRQWLRAQPSVRDENDSPPAPANDRLDVQVLPAASVVWSVTPAMNLRAAYGGTLARPLVRELAPYLYFDFIRNRNVSGNPALRSSYIHNVDLRWEWFPGAADVISASVFYKNFILPIEPAFPDRDGNSITYQNAAGASAIGAEFEGRFDLGRFWAPLRGVQVGANVALIHSQVSLAPEQVMNATSTDRPLAGQSPFVANAMVGIAPVRSRVSVFVFYNVFGRRLEDVGTFGLPDIYQDTFHQLDTSVQWDPTSHFQLRFVIRNALNQAPRYVSTEGYVAQQLLPASTVTLRATWSP